MIRPQFCPNKNCHMHYIDYFNEDWLIKKGQYSTKNFSAIQRFKCLFCRCGFSESTFRLDYYVKKITSYERL